MIFLTGATGFIGWEVLKTLLQKNEKVFVLTRRPFPGTEQSVLPILSGLTNREIYKEFLGKSDCVVHIAGCAKAFSKDPNEFYQTNYSGTKAIIEEALNCGVKKIVYISTCMVFGHSSDKELSEEDFKERNNFLTDYEKSKYMAEKYVRSKIKEGAPIVILYPTRVFGKGKLTQGNSLTKLICFFTKFKYFPVIESPRFYGNYVYIEDVVNIILKAIYEVQPPQTFLVAGYNLSFLQFFNTLNNILNYNGKIITIRKMIAMQLAKFFENLEIETGIPASISRGWVKTFTTDWLYSNEKVRTHLDYGFMNFEEALHKTVQWLKNLLS